MTTFYLDFEGGNDANTGVSFAQRWKTIDLGATAARTAPGDTIRMMGSPAPTSLGQTATWTDASDTVTLTTAVTADIDAAASAWTASANVTTSTDATNYKEGAQSVSAAVAGAFTTGLAAYKATGTLDLSAYQQVSFWIRSALAVASGVYELKLCSDAAGVTPVNTITVPALSASIWHRVTVNTGGALGSAIQSVALYVVTDLGASAITILLDNIIACKSVASADSLSLNSLISPQSANDQPWYCINSIRGTTIKLGSYIGVAGGVNGKYYGEASPSALVATTYKREAIPVIRQTMQESGTIAAEIAYVGGYNRTDMSTQDGVTWIRPQDGASASGTLQSLFSIYLNYTSVDKLYIANASRTCFSMSGNTSLNGRFKEVGAAGGKNFFDVDSSNGAYSILFENVTFITGCGAGIRTGNTNQGGLMTARVKKIHSGCKTETTSIAGQGIISGGGFGTRLIATVDEICGFAEAVTLPDGLATLELFGTTFRDNVVDVNTNTLTIPWFAGGVRLINPIFSSGDITLDASSDCPIELHGVNGDLTDQRYYHLGGASGSRVITATDQRHTASDKSWKFLLTGVVPEHRKMERVVGRAAVDANSLVTATLWAYRDQSYVNGRLLLRPWLPGIAVAGVSADLTLTSTWEQLSLTFTPTVAGVFELVFQTWGTSASSGNVWIDDIGITQ